MEQVEDVGWTPTADNAVLSLPGFHISPETGFLPATPPLTALPGEYFAPWENIMSRLPELNKTKQLRTEVDKLPERDFNHSTLKSEQEWWRAYVVMCFVGQSYIWGEGQSGIVDKVPRKLAVPWCAISDYLHMKPMICYAVTVLNNYRLQDSTGPCSVDNLCITNTFTGTEDEHGFYLTNVLMELIAAPAVNKIGQVFEDMLHHRDTAVIACLQTLQHTLQNLRRELAKIKERCKPVAFYTDIRPFQAGTEGLDAFPDGIIYEGVDTKPRQYIGASAGQSSIIHVFDIFLGVRHTGSTKESLETMRLHMPREHGEFLAQLGRLPSVREYCRGSDSLIGSYNSAVQEMVHFRSDHVKIVTRYIVNQCEHSVNPTLNDKGSGGTPFMLFLKEIRDATQELLI